MCGIAGVYDPGGTGDVGVVDAMVSTLAHRGPDSWGVHVGDQGAIGQTRLAVIDLVTGDPPITDASGDVGVALNGEIYNYGEHRQALRAAGRTFRTTGDTEVIAQLAVDLEPLALARALDGMFAVAVLDRRHRRLSLLRDRFGKKPLHYWTDGRRVAFGSELKALLAHPWVPRRLDESAIPAYLTFGYVPTPRTFFDGVRTLPAGHVLVADDRGVRVERYWGPSPLPRARQDRRPDAVLAVEARRLLAAAVEKRLVSDVPLGAFLSGGIDSSAVVALMSEASTEPVRTFTIGFDDRDGFDERAYASKVARQFRTEHTELVVAPNDIGLVEKLLWHFDQPFADSSALPTYLLSEMTRHHVTVALCGDGGDEIFAGYERFLAALLADRYRQLPAPLRRGIRSAAALLPLPQKADRLLRRADLGLPDALRSWISYVPEETVEALLPGFDRWALDDYRRVWSESEGAGTLARILDLNLRTYLVDDLLPKVDRTSMAHGLEVRAPFLDPDLADFTLSLPGHRHIRGRTLKRLLKLAMRGTLPDEILHRGKRGFGVPLDRWFRTDLQGYVASALGPGASVRGHLRGDAIDGLLAEHAGGQPRGHELWSLLVLETFLRREGW